MRCTPSAQASRSIACAHELPEVFRDDAIGDHAQARDLPAPRGTSRLSPHLHSGGISPRQINFELDRRVRATGAKRRPDIEPYLRELGWREFAHHLLFHFPHAPSANFNPRFDAFPWAPVEQASIDRWQCGRTGNRWSMPACASCGIPAGCITAGA